MNQFKVINPLYTPYLDPTLPNPKAPNPSLTYIHQSPFNRLTRPPIFFPSPFPLGGSMKVSSKLT